MLCLIQWWIYVMTVHICEKSRGCTTSSMNPITKYAFWWWWCANGEPSARATSWCHPLAWGGREGQREKDSLKFLTSFSGNVNCLKINKETVVWYFLSVIYTYYLFMSGLFYSWESWVQSHHVLHSKFKMSLACINRCLLT